MSHNPKLHAAAVSGIVEVSTTYPIDFLKVIRQSSKPMSLFWSNPYRGVSARFMGVVPTRMLFWNSIYYCKHNELSLTQTSLLLSSLLTLVDYPIEQVSVRKMLYKAPLRECFKKATLVPGLSATLLRNFGFIYTMNYSITRQSDKHAFTAGAMGGLFGALLTHPLDTLKTHYHYQDTHKLPTHTLKQYYRGCAHRCIRCLTAMGIGWYVFNLIE